MHDGIDPYTPEEPLYECLDCGERSSSGSGGSCGACGGTLKNIAVPWEITPVREKEEGPGRPVSRA